MTKTIKTTTFILMSAIFFSGCDAVDDAVKETVNDVLSGDVDEATIRAKERVLILNNVNRTACVIIKNSFAENGNRKNAETLVVELGVNCATYGKIVGDPLELENDVLCTEESLSEWLEQGNNNIITNFDSAKGNKACVIGFDL